MAGPVNHSDLYRLPWTLPDNAINWLEPTSMCNLYCDGCYRKNDADSHKPLEQTDKGQCLSAQANAFAPNYEAKRKHNQVKNAMHS